MRWYFQRIIHCPKHCQLSIGSHGPHQVRVPDQVFIHLRGGGPALGDGPHHQGLAPAHIAGGEDFARAGSITVRLRYEL